MEISPFEHQMVSKGETWVPVQLSLSPTPTHSPALQLLPTMFKAFLPDPPFSQAPYSHQEQDTWAWRSQTGSIRVCVPSRVGTWACTGRAMESLGCRFPDCKLTSCCPQGPPKPTPLTLSHSRKLLLVSMSQIQKNQELFRFSYSEVCVGEQRGRPRAISLGPKPQPSSGAETSWSLESGSAESGPGQGRGRKMGARYVHAGFWRPVDGLCSLQPTMKPVSGYILLLAEILAHRPLPYPHSQLLHPQSQPVMGWAAGYSFEIIRPSLLIQQMGKWDSLVFMPRLCLF